WKAVDEQRVSQMVWPILQAIDGQLGELERNQPDPANPETGRLEGGALVLEGTFKESGHGKLGYPLSYAAAALGWESPEVQSRLERLRAAHAAWRRCAQGAVARIAGAQPRS